MLFCLPQRNVDLFSSFTRLANLTVHLIFKGNGSVLSVNDDDSMLFLFGLGDLKLTSTRKSAKYELVFQLISLMRKKMVAVLVGVIVLVNGYNGYLIFDRNKLVHSLHPLGIRPIHRCSQFSFCDEDV